MFNFNDQETKNKDLALTAIYTPGHISDHMSFLLNDDVLFSGDIILGSPSTAVEDLSVYMKTLKKLRKYKFNWICVPHSTSLDLETCDSDPVMFKGE